jgi:N-acyl-D-amino-acid deacylase
MAVFDLLVKNGIVIDGSGNPMKKADIGIINGKITELGNITGYGKRTIDAKGLYVTPGFIDNHSHSDWTILVHPSGDSKIMQGVTTELNGLCGYAAAPLPREDWWKLLYIRMTVGWSMHYAAAAYNWGPLPYGKEVNVDWSTMSEYLDRVDRNGVGLNYCMLFGHGAIRYFVMGVEARTAWDDDIMEMKLMAAEAMKQGAFGMSSGLSGCPGCWADTDELIELCKVVKKYDGVYMPHQRSSTLKHSIEESIKIAEETGVRTCMSHTRLNTNTLELVKRARDKGVDITYDAFPYPGSIAGNIVYMLPHWLSRRREEGFEGWIIDQLKKPEVRKRFVEVDYPNWRKKQVSIPGIDIFKQGQGGELSLEPNWSAMQVQKVRTQKNRKYIGMTFSEIAEARGVDPWTAWFDILVEEQGYVRWLGFHGESYEDVYNPDFESQLKVPFVSIESDSPIESPRGVTITSTDPRSYGTFPLVLGEYVRKRKKITWEDAIMKMTLNPAKTIGLKDRGLLREGYWADITIFDPKIVSHKANFKNCLEVSPLHKGLNYDLYPIGIHYTIVNGITVVEKGKMTGERPGQVLRHTTT